MWKLRDIVVAAILSVVSGAVYMGWDFLTQVMTATWSPAAAGLVNGLWWVAAGLVPYIVRRPGAAFLAETVSALCELAFGSPYGPAVIISGLVQGAGAEAGFALGGWRRYNLGWMLLAGALGGVGNSVQYYFQYGGNKLAFGMMLGYVLTTMASGAVLGGWLPKVIGDALYRTGSLRNFEIARQRRAGAQPDAR